MELTAYQKQLQHSKHSHPEATVALSHLNDVAIPADKAMESLDDNAYKKGMQIDFPFLALNIESTSASNNDYLDSASTEHAIGLTTNTKPYTSGSPVDGMDDNDYSNHNASLAENTPTLWIALGGGAIGFVLSMLLIPHWSGAVDDGAVKAIVIPLANSAKNGVIPKASIKALVASNPHTSDAYITKQPINTKSLSSDDLQKNYAQILQRMDSLQHQFSVSTKGLEHIELLFNKIDYLDNYLKKLSLQKSPAAVKPDFIVSAMKQLGGESWVTIVDKHGTHSMMRSGETFKDWRLLNADPVAKIAVYENRQGDRFRVSL